MAISSSSSTSSSSSDYLDVNSDVIVAMASREYGQGRIFIHTDRMGGYKTGHGDNTSAFWRKILEWTSKKSSIENINVGLIISVQPSSADHMNSLNPIVSKKIKVSDLATKDLSLYDCLYFVGLPDSVSNNVSEKIEQFVSNGGGVIIEYPNIGGQYINVLADIENIYCYSSERLLQTNAYWTIDGGNSYVFNESADVSFMSTLRQEDFSSSWTILMTNIMNLMTTTTTTFIEDAFDFDKTSSAEFSVSFISAMQKGIVILNSNN